MRPASVKSLSDNKASSPLPTIIDFFEGDPNSGASTLTFFILFILYAGAFWGAGHILANWLYVRFILGESPENMQPFSFKLLYFTFGLFFCLYSLFNMMRKSKIEDPADPIPKNLVSTIVILRTEFGLIYFFPFMLIYGIFVLFWPIFVAFYVSEKVTGTAPSLKLSLDKKL